MVKKEGMSLQNPVMPEKDKYTSLIRTRDKVIVDVKVKKVFPTEDNI